MRNNQQDWTLADLKRLTNHFEIQLRQGKGSHIYLTFPNNSTLSVPVKRPIKAIYIIQFLELLDALQNEQEQI